MPTCYGTLLPEDLPGEVNLWTSRACHSKVLVGIYPLTVTQGAGFAPALYLASRRLGGFRTARFIGLACVTCQLTLPVGLTLRMAIMCACYWPREAPHGAYPAPIPRWI